jgi:type II restriction enzyme
MILVEDSPNSRYPVRDSLTSFSPLVIFKGTSYLGRYDLLCQRLVQERLYSSASVIAARRLANDEGQFSEFSIITSLKTFVATLAGHIATQSIRLK